LISSKEITCHKYATKIIILEGFAPNISWMQISEDKKALIVWKRDMPGPSQQNHYRE
jgi:hypothetical protein